MMLATLSALSLVLVSVAVERSALAEGSVIMTNATMCLDQSDFNEIILEIEKGGNDEDVYKSKPGCDSIKEGVIIQIVKKVDEYEFKGRKYWLVESKLYNSELILYVGLPAYLFFDSKNIV